MWTFGQCFHLRKASIWALRETQKQSQEIPPLSPTPPSFFPSPIPISCPFPFPRRIPSLIPFSVLFPLRLHSPLYTRISLSDTLGSLILDNKKTRVYILFDRVFTTRKQRRNRKTITSIKFSSKFSVKTQTTKSLGYPMPPSQTKCYSCAWAYLGGSSPPRESRGGLNPRWTLTL